METLDGLAYACRRLAGGELRQDRNGDPFWLYIVSDRPAKTPEFPPSPIAVTTAAPDTLHSVYQALLSCLPLSDDHAANLIARGLSREQIARNGYRSMPPWRSRAHIVGDLEKAYDLAAIPGFYMANGRFRLAGAVGILIPVRDLRGRIVALKVRADAASGPKYTWLSSATHGGPGPGAPAHVPLFSGPTDTVRLTEGPLKADIATALTGVLTIGLPGIAAWRRGLAIIKQLGARTVLFACDGDWRTNEHVRCARDSALERLASYG